MRIVIVTALVIGVIGVMRAGEAHAQRAPDLATLDRGDGITKLGIDLAYTALDATYSGALRVEIAGQYVLQSGLGFYGALPIAHSFGAEDPEPAPQEATAIGNLELGLLFVITSSPRFSWVFRGGLAVPTASDSLDGATTNALATFPRFTDLALTVPDAYYVRLGVSPLYHDHKLFARADLGLDIGSDDAGAADELLRVNAGIGYDFGIVAPSIELVNTWTFGDGPDDDFHLLALTFRFMGEQLQPFLSVGTPLDDTRDIVPFWLAGGIQFAP